MLEELLCVLLKSDGRSIRALTVPGISRIYCKAQPITLAHHMGAYFEMFKRDRSADAGHLYKDEPIARSAAGALGGNDLSVWTENILLCFSDFDRSDSEQYGFCVRTGNLPDRAAVRHVQDHDAP